MKKSGNGTLEKCPKCSSKQISATDWDGGLNEASCTVTCEKCGVRWTETYRCATWDMLD